MGVFDGVHHGHQQVIGQAVAAARARNLPAVVVTFDPHPSEVVRPGSHPAVLTPVERKSRLLGELGVDGVCVIPFTLEFSQHSPEEFVHDVLIGQLHAAVVVVGENFRFGHRAAGDFDLLRRLGERFGFSAQATPLRRGAVDGAGPAAAAEPTADEDLIYSSTYIRACVAAGDVTAAAAALGRPHQIEGLVVRGDQRGAGLGFPTANLAPPPFTAIPADGIYAGWLRRKRKPEEAIPAAVSVGSNPTFAGQHRRVEAHLLDFSGDLYGEQVSLDFVERLREMRRFDDIEQLTAAIADDVTNTRRVLRGA